MQDKTKKLHGRVSRRASRLISGRIVRRPSSKKSTVNKAAMIGPVDCHLSVVLRLKIHSKIPSGQLPLSP
jgi:hypothetical protein